MIDDGAGLPFVKGHGLGNDYIVVDAADLPWPLTPPRIRAICDRNRGAGSDGLLVGWLDRRPFRLRIYNPDGSEAEKSGNGLRIFGAYLAARGLVEDRQPFPVALVRDQVSMCLEDRDELRGPRIAVDMGQAVFRGDAVGFSLESGQVMDQELQLGEGGSARINLVSMANPHCVVFVDKLDRPDFLARAPLLAAHEAFHAGTNVQFARVTGASSLDVWIYERGVGETQASGSSACAAAAAAVKLGKCSPGLVTVDMPGGQVAVTVEAGGTVQLSGPVRLVYDGRFTAGVLAEWSRLD